MTTKKEFMSRPKIASLPLAQREARWKQHKQSPSGAKTFPQKGKGRASTPKVAAAVSYTANVRTGRPKLKQTLKSVIVKNREFIFDVSGSVAWALTQFVVNPGNVIMFPWLSKVAQNYESYRFRKLKFEYEPTCSTATKGTVMLVCEFNVNDSPPTSKQQMMSYADAARSAPWNRLVYSPKHSDYNRRKTYYVEDTQEDASLPLSGGNAENLDDCAVLLVSRAGMADTSNVGELYVEYEIELLTPQYNVQGGTQKLVSASSTGASMFENIANMNNGNPILKYVAGTAGTELTTDQPGTYLIAGTWEGSAGGTDTVDNAIFQLAASNSATIVAQHAMCSALQDDVTFWAIITFTQSSTIDLDSSSVTAWGIAAQVGTLTMYVSPFTKSVA